MRFALISLVVGSLLLIGACSDSSYDSGGGELPPPPPPPLNVIISGSIVDQLSGNIIENATLRFFEGSELATNILNTDGDNIDTINAADGVFQVTTDNDITTFKAVVSADGYYEKIAVVNFNASDKIVSLQVNMLEEDDDTITVEEEEFSIGGSEVTTVIAVSTDATDGIDSAQGSAGITVQESVILQDDQGNAVDVTSLSVEVSYIVPQVSSVTEIDPPESAPSTQQVYISDSQLAEDGDSVSVTFSYLSDNPETTGVGFSVNYDSDVLGVASISNVFPDSVQGGTQSDDSDDTDSDLATDQLLNFSWSSDSSSSGTAVSSVSIPELVADTQMVYVSSSTKSEDGTQETVVISYNADNTSSTGIGLGVHFDSSILTLSQSQVNEYDALVIGAAEQADASNADADAETDRMFNVNWAAFAGGWPGSGPVELATFVFDIAEGASGSSAINFSTSSTPPAFSGFSGQSHDLVFSVEPDASFPGSTTQELATVTFDISEGSYGYADINVIGTSSESNYTFIGKSQQIAIGDAPEEPVSIASLIPEGLNNDEDIDEVLVPVGVAEINMTSEDGTKIKKFSEEITITINLPENTKLASGENVQATDVFTVRSFDSDTLVWTTEDNEAVVGELENGLYPANLLVDHLTIFALAEKVTACNSPVTFSLSGDEVPASGLQLIISSDDIEKTVSVSSDSVTISAVDAKASGFVNDTNASYQVTIEDYIGNVWYESTDGTPICGNSIPLALANPVQTVDETLSVNQVCSNNSLVYSALGNAVVTYRKDATSATLTAFETSDGSGVYTLDQMDQSLSSYLVTIKTSKFGSQTTTVVPDGINESFDVETICEQATGLTGTGSS
ncbi:MAG: hypothetical protein P8I13_03285 [Porticoccaceae bacterium]|nr:hypothetical protein [Porticoccaceae bacterium]